MKPTLKRFASLAAIAAILLALHTASAAGLAIGAAMPSFALRSSDGQTVSSDAYRSKRAVVVVFTDNQCTYARAYSTRLASLESSYASQGVQFLIVNPHATPPEYGQKAGAEKSGYPFPVLMDDQQTVTRAFGATRVPEVYVFGPGGKLVYRGQIDDNTEEKMVRRADLRNALDSVLGGNARIEHPVTSAFGCTIKSK